MRVGPGLPEDGGSQPRRTTFACGALLPAPRFTRSDQWELRRVDADRAATRRGPAALVAALTE